MRNLAPAFLATLLAACGGGSSPAPADSPVPAPQPPPSNPVPTDPPDDPPGEPTPVQPGVIAVSRSGSQLVAATINGGSQSVIITFSAVDERQVDTLSLTSGLMSLPPGWQSPAEFACTDIDQGNSCSLALTYTPSAVGQGTLTLGYEYATTGFDTVSGEIVIPFEATANNNVVTTVTPMGPITGVIADGHRDVGVTFTSDDGNIARNLVVTSELAQLPAGWSSASPTFACGEVSTGSGCQLLLKYEPNTYGEGALSLAYEYTDNSGAAKQGTLEIPYLARVHNSVVATSSRALPFNVPIGASEQLTVTFTTDDGHPVEWIEVLTDLNSGLPVGWTAEVDSLRCENVSTGNGCQLTFTYEPSAHANSQFFLQYGWEDGAGRVNDASIAIGYNALTNNSVVGTADPSGQVAAMLGGTRPVRVTFTTDDSQIASDFAVDTDLSALPGGWSAQSSSLICSSVHSGGTCYIDLTFGPSSLLSGTLSLNYSYTNNAGTPQSGTTNVPYVTTTDNNVVVSASPAAPYIRAISDNLPFTLTFTSDDGQPITAFATTTALNTLPSVHSAQSSKTCATVSTGASCTLGLTFQPGGTRSGTIAINYSYVNNAGIAKTGTVNLPFESWPPLVYISSYTQDAVYRCEKNNSTGALSNCSTTGISLNGATELAFDRYGADHWAYVSGYDARQILRCTHNVNGALTDCSVQATLVNHPYTMVEYGGALLVSAASLQRCPINADGTLGTCVATTGGPVSITGLEAVSGGLMVADEANNRLVFCSWGGSETAFLCISQLTGLSDPHGIAEFAGTVYVVENGTSRVRACNWDWSSDLPVMNFCVSNDIGMPDIREIRIAYPHALITSAGKVVVCDVGGYYDNELSNCRDSGAPDVGLAVSITRR